jgi:hypothetical protein
LPPDGPIQGPHDQVFIAEHGRVALSEEDRKLFLDLVLVGDNQVTG